MTVKRIPNLYLGVPDATLDEEIWKFEEEGATNLNGQDDEQALFYGGEVAGRIDDIPTVAELVTRISQEAEEVLKSLPRFIGSDI